MHTAACMPCIARCILSGVRLRADSGLRVRLSTLAVTVCAVQRARHVRDGAREQRSAEGKAQLAQARCARWAALFTISMPLMRFDPRRLFRLSVPVVPMVALSPEPQGPYSPVLSTFRHRMYACEYPSTSFRAPPVALYCRCRPSYRSSRVHQARQPGPVLSVLSGTHSG